MIDIEKLFDRACVVFAILFSGALLFDPNLSIFSRIFGAVVSATALALPAVMALRDAKPYSPLTHDGANHETDIESVPE